MYHVWLYLHILGAIIAFGFGFYAPIFGRSLAAEPQHGNWYLRAVKRVSNAILIPVAISMAVTGTLLVAETGGASRFQQLWLAVAVMLYVLALVIVFLGQRPALGRVIALTSQPPGPGGPPAELVEDLNKLKVYGYALIALVLVIVGLMVFKPDL
jgi:hypothetical protein